jgi:hypothetical protein
VPGVTKASHHTHKKGDEPGQGKGRIRDRFRGLSRSWLWCLFGGPKSVGSSTRAFYLQNVRFYSGGTRIRTGDTMIFSRRHYVLGRTTLSAKSALLQVFLGFGDEGLSAAY